MNCRKEYIPVIFRYCNVSIILNIILLLIVVGSLCSFTSENVVLMPISQQSQKTTGTVVDEAGIPIIGANIVVKGKNVGVITDIDGNFSIETKANDILLVSYIGYIPSEISVSNKTHFQITLKEDLQKLEEVVVVGYGSQKKATLTGAVSAVTSKDMVVTKNQFVSNSLSGKVPGLRVWEKTSEPGATGMQDFQIRGMGGPMVVIDGVPRTDMDRLDPNEVESISVLKDASAAIYGVRAANGVILVTTKKGAKGKAELSYNGFYGFQRAIGLPDVLDAVEYMTLMNERELNNSRPFLFSKDQIDEYRNGTKQSTDWAHMGQRESFLKNHNISALAMYEEEVISTDNFAGLRETSMDVIDEMFAGNSNNQQATQNTDEIYENTNKAFVGRINYDFKSKYE